MAKKYTRKNVSTLAELNQEQERIRYRAKRIEDSLLDMVSPQQLAITAASRLLSRKKKPAAQYFSSGRKAGKKQRKAATGEVHGKVAEWLSKPEVKKILKTVGISFLRWQAFNLALFLGKKLVKKLKEGKKTKQALA